MIDEIDKIQHPNPPPGANEVYKSFPWAYDVWSLGVILLELAAGSQIESSADIV